MKCRIKFVIINIAVLLIAIVGLYNSQAADVTDTLHIVASNTGVKASASPWQSPASLLRW